MDAVSLERLDRRIAEATVAENLGSRDGRLWELTGRCLLAGHKLSWGHERTKARGVGDTKQNVLR